MKRVVVTGIGVVAPGSVGKEALWDNMRRGKVFTGPMKTLDPKGIRCPVSAEIEEASLLPYRHKIEASMASNLSRAEFLGILATDLALHDSGLTSDNLCNSNIHAAIGSTMGIEDSLLKREPLELLKNPTQDLIRRYAPVKIVNAIKKYLRKIIAIDENEGNRITTRMFMNACAAGNYAIGDAVDEINQGECNIAFAGGVDAFSYLAIVGFNRLLSVTPDVCRPFDRDRRGIVVGEGAGILVLEEKEHALMRGAHIYGEISGYGLGVDGFHITTPDPEGRGAIRAMERALAQGGISPAQIDYISAHGTGTVANDVTEYTAARAVFGEKIPPMSSIKSMIGHTMGAASGIEAAACCLMLDREELLPTANFVTPDESCPVDCVPNFSRPAKLTFIMSNSLAFGGNNSSIIFSKKDTAAQKDKKEIPLQRQRKMKLVFTHTLKKEEAELYFQNYMPQVKVQMADIQSLMLTAAIHRGLRENKITNLPKEETAIISASFSGAIVSSIEFLLNTMEKGAIGASPMAFPNTVGNAPASRAAIWLGFKDKVISLAGEEEDAGAAAIYYAKKLLAGDSKYVFTCECSENQVTVSLLGRNYN